MEAMFTYGTILALFNLGTGEIILVLTLILILFAAKRIPDLARGLGTGIDEFRKKTREVTEEVAQESFDAGQSFGGIYGKPAAEALTIDNQVAELYDPAALRTDRKPQRIRTPWYQTFGKTVRCFFKWLRKLRIH